MRLYALDPYTLRAKELTAPLSLPEFGRVLLHLAKRRGFQSNRRVTAKKEEEGKIKDGLKRLAEDLGEKTLGQHFSEHRQENRFVAIRNRRDSYRWMTHRDQYRQEFDRLWESQQRFHPDQLLGELRQRIAAVLFFQLPFELSHRRKQKVIGRCTLFPTQQRCPLAERAAQCFRVMQKLNDLRIRDSHGRDRPLTVDQWQAVRARLMTSKKVKFDSLRKLLKLVSDEQFNFEFEGNSDLTGHEIDAQLAGRKVFGTKGWGKLTDQHRDQVWQRVVDWLIKGQQSPDDLAVAIEQDFGIKAADPSILGKLHVPPGHVAYSKKALAWLLPELEKGHNLHDARQAVAAAAGFRRTWRTHKQLPPPDRAHGFETTNPTVRAVLHQVRQVVNALIRDLGKPERFVVEFARPLKANKEGRQEILRRQARNRKARLIARERICEARGWPSEAAAKVSGKDVNKYLLWQEQGEYCPYSGRRIGVEVLLNGETEIDHIIPRSLSLDNSLNNKVVCFTAANRDKGQRTPFDWLGADPKRWPIVERVIARWNPKATANDESQTPATGTAATANLDKWRRFHLAQQDIAEKYTPNYLLNDTSFLSRMVRDYLKRLYPVRTAIDQQVRTSKGGVTSELRKFWGLNALLGSDDPKAKNRADLRHHALDAAVIAVTEANMVQKVTAALHAAGPWRRASELNVPLPWRSYRDDLQAALSALNVSHRVERKAKGALHKETYYAKETNGAQAGKFITRKPVASLTRGMVERIVDKEVKKLAHDRLTQFDGDAKKAFAEPLALPNGRAGETPVYRVRVWENSNTMIPIRGPQRGKQTVWVEPGSNHHLAIFEVEQRGEVGWVRTLCSTYEAAQRLRRREPVIRRQHPDFSEARFVMSLSKGETLLFQDEQGQSRLARVRKFSAGDLARPEAVDLLVWELTLGDLNENITKDTPNVWRLRNINDLRKMQARKVTVDALGRIRWAHD